MLSSLTKSTYEAILKSELRPAMGCTEPIAIAYAAAILHEALGELPKEIDARFSGNIIKNVKSVIVPATGGRHGIEAALAAGIVSGRADKKLEVLTALTPTSISAIDDVMSRCRIKISKMTVGCSFGLELYASSNGKTASVKIDGAHTNVVRVLSDGLDITDRYAEQTIVEESGDAPDLTLLNVQDIIEYADGNGRDTVNKERLRHRIDIGGKNHQRIDVGNRRTNEAVLSGQDLFYHALSMLYGDFHHIAGERRIALFPQNASCTAGNQARVCFYIIKTAQGSDDPPFHSLSHGFTPLQ